MNHIHEMKESSYVCPECGLHYKEKEWAGKCELWCNEHHSCNLDIIKHAVESEHN